MPALATDATANITTTAHNLTIKVRPQHAAYRGYLPRGSGFHEQFRFQEQRAPLAIEVLVLSSPSAGNKRELMFVIARQRATRWCLCVPCTCSKVSVATKECVNAKAFRCRLVAGRINNSPARHALGTRGSCSSQTAHEYRCRGR